MKSFLILILILFGKQAFASDTLRFDRVFSKIETEVLRDTLMNINETFLDTFVHRPTFVFISRHFDGSIRKGFYVQLLFQSIIDPSIRFGQYFDGINDSINFSDDYYRGYFKEGEKYLVQIVYYNGKQLDTINMKTIISVDSKSSLTYVFEVKFGTPEIHVNCEIHSEKKFSVEQKELMRNFLVEQDRYYFFNEEVNRNLRYSIIELLKLTYKQSKKIHFSAWAWVSF